MCWARRPVWRQFRSIQSITSFLNARRRKLRVRGKGDSDFDGSGATLGWRADVLWVVGIRWLIADSQRPDGFASLLFGECERVEECRFETKYGNNSLHFPSILFLSFSGSFAAAKKSGAGTRRGGWCSSVDWCLTRVRSKNGELGRSVGSWNRLSAPWACLFRQLKIVHGANQREPRVLFSVKNDGHQSTRRRLCSSSVRAYDQPDTLVSGNLRLCRCFLTPAGGVLLPTGTEPTSLLENAASAWVCWACRFQ